MGQIVYAAAMSHVLYPDYYEKKADTRALLADADLTDEERDAFARWDARRLNELGGSLHLILSIPRLGGH